jgi:succinylglutamate desuccinylase
MNFFKPIQMTASATRTQRIINRYKGQEHGVLFIALGGMHGNEIAGVQAIETVFEMLQEEKKKNPDFIFTGCFLGLHGNLEAINAKQRQIEKDLNRQFTPQNIARLRSLSTTELKYEDRELLDLITTITQEIATYKPSRLVILDIHTTSASGGIFAITSDMEQNIRIATKLHAPVVLGMLDGLQGTTLHYFTTPHFEIETLAVSLEAGQHDEPESVDRAISAIINCMRTIGCVLPNHVEHKHDDVLKRYSKNLPKVVELRYIHRLQPKDRFVMRPGYVNFQPIEKGEILAEDRHGVIRAKENGYILMPLYQQQGEDGFFVVREVPRIAF